MCQRHMALFSCRRKAALCPNASQLVIWSGANQILMGLVFSCPAQTRLHPHGLSRRYRGCGDKNSWRSAIFVPNHEFALSPPETPSKRKRRRTVPFWSTQAQRKRTRRAISAAFFFLFLLRTDAGRQYVLNKTDNKHI